MNTKALKEQLKSKRPDSVAQLVPAAGTVSAAASFSEPGNGRRSAASPSVGVEALGPSVQVSGAENLRWAAGFAEPGREEAGCLGLRGWAGLRGGAGRGGDCLLNSPRQPITSGEDLATFLTPPKP